MKRSLLQFLTLVAVFLLFAIPFKAMNLIPGFTDVRPVTALGPIYALFYGPMGCLANACGNLIADILDNALRWSSLAGFSANFLGPCLVWYFWKRVAGPTFALRGPRELLIHTLLLIVKSLFEAAIITPSVAYAYPEVNAKMFALIVFFNTAVFPIFIGMPITMLMQEEFGFVPCLQDDK